MSKQDALLSSPVFARRLQVPIQTTRLHLRPFGDEDVDAIAELLSDHQATEFIGGIKNREAAAASVRLMGEAFASRGWGTLSVRLSEDARCIGYCGVRPLIHTQEIEIAFALQRGYWNLGYATEAAKASMDSAFSSLGIESIVATVYPDNKASIRVLEKLGMEVHCEVFGHWPLNTALLYRIDRGTWAAAL